MKTLLHFFKLDVFDIGTDWKIVHWALFTELIDDSIHLGDKQCLYLRPRQTAKTTTFNKFILTKVLPECSNFMIS